MKQKTMKTENSKAKTKKSLYIAIDSKTKNRD